MISSEVSGFIFGAVACSIAIGTVLWRILTLKINGELSILRHSLEVKDMAIENLQNVQILLNKGLEEKFEHFSSRVKAETIETNKRLKQVELFLSKSTAYEPRE